MGSTSSSARCGNSAGHLQVPPAEFFGADAYLELVAACSVEVDDAVSVAFRERESGAGAVVLKMAEDKREELAGAVDLVAGVIGLRLHRQWLSGDSVERLLAFRGARSVAFSTPFKFHVVANPKVDEAKLNAVVSGLPPLRRPMPYASSVLSWLLRAWGTSDDPINEFVSLFVPLEMILGNPEPPDASWSDRATAVREIIRLHAGERTTELLEFLEKAVQPPSVLVRRFTKLARAAALPGWEADIRAVRQFASIRRELLHRGKKREVALKATAGVEEVRTLEYIVERYVSYVLFADVAIHKSAVHADDQVNSRFAGPNVSTSASTLPL
jgi:hypothetical protein